MLFGNNTFGIKVLCRESILGVKVLCGENTFMEMGVP